MSGERDGHRYTPFYCEENIWHLVHERAFAGRSARVVFISNPRRACAFWEQRAASSPEAPVVWDYHVVLLVDDRRGTMVWDLDTRLELPLPLERYLEATFRPLPIELDLLAPRFRIIDAEVFRESFSSDRSHMRAPDGSWLHPPPAWPAIHHEGTPSFLRWTEMAEGDGDVLDLRRLASR